MGNVTKIPTVIALLLLVLIVGGIIAAFEFFTRLPITATGSTQPSRVSISNSNDSSFTVSWTTGLAATGAVKVLPRGPVFYDDRDSSGKLGKYMTHHVTVGSRQANTTYTIEILSNGKTYKDLGNIPWQAQTGQTLVPNSQGLEPAYGTVVTSSGLPAEGALVYLNLEGSQVLSTYVKASGSWIIPLNLLRSLDGNQYVSVGERSIETLRVVLGEEESKAITDTANDAPVPEMVIGKSYDFNKLRAKTGGATMASLSGKSVSPVLGAESSQPISDSAHVSLLTPAQGATIPSSRPLISGTGVPNRLVTVTLGITSLTSDTTRVGRDGQWRYTPARPLAAGTQSVTMTTLDEKGKPAAITHTFVVLKSGTQVLGEATPSGTLTPTSTPIPTTTIETTPEPTSTQEAEPIPTTGSTLPTIILILLGLGLLSGGAVVFIKK